MERTLQKEKVWLPEYGGASVVNVPSSLLTFFGIRPPTPPLHPSLLPLRRYEGFKKALLLIFDSLGYHRLMASGASKGLHVAPITSVCPSTTVAALTSFYTAVPPSTHGLVGFRLFLKEWGLIANMIKLSPAGYQERDALEKMGFDPARLLPVKTVFELLKEKRIRSYAFTKMHYYRSGLSSLMHRGAEIVPYVNPIDLFTQIKKLIKKTRGRIFITAYLDDIDIISHYYGTGTEEERTTIIMFFRILEEILLGARINDTLMLLTSDHGQVPSPQRKKVDILRFPALLGNLVMPPTGEFRTSYLHIKQGCRAGFIRKLKRELGQRFIVLTRDEAAGLGLFGRTKIPARHAERMGDVVLIAKGEHYLYYPYGDFELKARHGGLNENEMLVPLINLSDYSRQLTE